MDRLSEEEIIEKIKDYIELLSIDEKPLELPAIFQKEWAETIQGLLDLYQKEKEKNKKVKKFCKEKSTFQTFGDEDMKYVLETYINRLKNRILDLLED